MTQFFQRIKKFFYHLLNKLKRNYKRVVVWVILALMVCGAGAGLFVTQTSEQTRAAIIHDNPLVSKLLPIYWSIRKISDILYLPYFFKKNHLPTYELVISEKNLQKLNDSLPKEFSGTFLYDKVSVPAEFRANGKTYSVKVRYRGDNAVHWNAPKRSYSVEFDKDGPFEGMDKLNFIIPDDRNFVMEHFNNFRAGQLGLLYPQSGFANLKLNGHSQGLYFTIEGWSKEMLAKWEVPDASNFYAEQDRELQANIVDEYRVWENSDGWQKLVSDGQLGYEHYSEINKLLELLNNAGDEEFNRDIFNLVDKDNFYAWQIHQELVNSTHQAFYNIRLFFNNTSGKFYFIPWDVEIVPAEVDNADFYGTLAKRIFSNPEFLLEKDARFYAYVSDNENLKSDLEFYDQTYKEIQNALYQDRIKIYTNLWADKVIAANRREIINNVNKIKERLEVGSAFVDIGLFGEQVVKFGTENALAYLDFNVKSPSGLMLTEILPEFKPGFQVGGTQLYYDSNTNDQPDAQDKKINDPAEVFLFIKREYNSETKTLDPVLTRHRFYLASNSISAAEYSDNLIGIALKMQNAVTGQRLKDKDLSIKLSDVGLFSRLGEIVDIAAFQKENPTFRVDGARKEIYLPSGSYEMSRTIIVPPGYTLKILPATTLRFRPGVSLISYSAVSAQGTLERPIEISGTDPARPWGVFAVLNSPEPSRFVYANFSNGKDEYLNGVYFSGMLSVYHSDVFIEHSIFRGANADDGVNVKSAKAEIVSSKFIGNSADAIDFDFIKEGRVADSEFVSNGNDGIDLSGSAVLISGNYIEKSGDKCISVGEKALDTVIYNNILNGCNVGIEIKDLSDIAIINNVIVNNNFGLNAYRKKAFFGGGRAMVYNSIIWNNQITAQQDEFSQIEFFNSDYPDGSNGNVDIEPAFVDSATRNYSLASVPGNADLRKAGDAAILKDKLGIELSEAPIGLLK